MTHLGFFQSRGWTKQSSHSLSEVHKSIHVPKHWPFWRKLLAFSGPGYLVAVGYMDPGNWATDLAGGSRFGYSLLFVILLANMFAILLQYLSAKLGIVTGKDLAQMCHDKYPRPIRISLWLMAEVMITACDLAEVIGSAIALNLLFHIPLLLGVVITATDVLVLLFLQNKGFRYLESLVLILIGTIVVCFGLELIFSHPAWVLVLHGFIPTTSILTNHDMLYIAIGILGATVMPHNLYLHSAVVQTRDYEETHAGKVEAVHLAGIDSTAALCIAFFINAAILIMSSAVFHVKGYFNVAEIAQAHSLLAPLLGTTFASILFALALLASGQNSTITGTLAGQIIMEGFLNWRIAPWLRRLITRLLAIVPAIIVIILYGDGSIAKLLVFSQVVLSMQLVFAVFPLVFFTSSKKDMGVFVNSLIVKILAYLVAGIIAVLNGWLIYTTFFH